MKTDKTKLLQDIEAMKEKLASMEKELGVPEELKHFPSKGEKYYYYTSKGTLGSKISYADGLRVNVYKSVKEAQESYNKAVAVEKIKRRIIELQGDWKPNWSNDDEKKFCLQYEHNRRGLISIYWITTQQDISLPYMKSKYIAEVIIKEMEDELKLIFDIS